MDQYKAIEMAYSFARYKNVNKVVQCIDKPSILKLVGNLTDKSIIDYGCGSGFHTRLFAPLAIKTIGVDYSDYMIEVAKNLDKEVNITNVEYHVANCAEDLNLGQHDIVFSSFLINHSPDRIFLEKILRSMYNSLKPGGLCCGITYNSFLKSSDFPYLRKYDYDIHLNENPKEGDQRTIIYHKFNFTLYDHYIPPDVIEDTFKKVGFINFKWIHTKLDEKFSEEAEFLADYLAHPNGIMYYSEKPAV